MGTLLLAMLSWMVAGCGQPATEEARPLDAQPQAACPIHFRDVTEAAGLGGFVHHTGAFGEKWLPETMGSGGAFFDYDGDGWMDLLLVGGGSWPQQRQEPVQALRLYRNNHDGTFTEATAEAGFDGLSTYGFGVAAADYDNDGDEDVYLTTLYENLLLRNDDGSFTEVGRAVGVAGDTTWSTAAVFFDADRDGWVDLYVGNYVRWSPEGDIPCTITGQERAYCQPSLYQSHAPSFYHNKGDGTFTDWTKEAGIVPAPGNALGAVALDFNRDGWPDLAVANDLQRDLLYVNDGDGTFSERGTLSGMAFDENGRARGGMGVDAGVVDSSEQVSLFVGNFAEEMIGVYRHLDGGLFVDRAAVSRIGRPSLPVVTFGLFLFDADLDGDLDLFAANGHIRDNIELQRDGSSYRQPAQLFLSQNDGRFVFCEADSANALATPLIGRGTAYADYDRDGDLDILITENGGPAHLWRNEHRTPNASLRVRLVGTQSNRSALGARLVASIGGRTQERLVRGGGSYLSQSESVVTFGLGEQSALDSLSVFWPSGHVDRFGELTGGRQIRITEGTGEVQPDR